jgi:hypothetical protein
MTDININDLNPAGADLFDDSESFLYDLDDRENGIVGGGGISINGNVSINGNISIVGTAAVTFTINQSATVIQTQSAIGR